MATIYTTSATENYACGYFLVDSPATVVTVEVGFRPSKAGYINASNDKPLMWWDLVPVLGASYYNRGINPNTEYVVGDGIAFLEKGFTIGVLAGYTDGAGDLIIWEAWR